MLKLHFTNSELYILTSTLQALCCSGNVVCAMVAAVLVMAMFIRSAIVIVAAYLDDLLYAVLSHR